jgi:vancomycin permeability regulator SanA
VTAALDSIVRLDQFHLRSMLVVTQRFTVHRVPLGPIGLMLDFIQFQLMRVPSVTELTNRFVNLAIFV